MSLKLVILVCCVFLGTATQAARIKRASSIALTVGENVAGPFPNPLIKFPIVSEATGGCGKKHGCYNGYCWAGCDATLANNEWCYTTRGFSQDFHYVTCSSDAECDSCWLCAGSCTI